MSTDIEDRRKEQIVTSWLKGNRSPSRSLGGAYKEEPAVAKARLELSERIRFKKNKYER